MNPNLNSKPNKDSNNESKNNLHFKLNRKDEKKHYNGVMDSIRTNFSAVLNAPDQKVNLISYFSSLRQPKMDEYIPTVKITPYVDKNITYESFKPYIEEMKSVNFSLYNDMKTDESFNLPSPKTPLSNSSSTSSLTDYEKRIKSVIRHLCLDEGVPEVFFHENFDLHDPAIFENVLGRYDGTYLLIEKKLEYYCELVETTLSEQVSIKSQDAFEALENFYQLQATLNETWNQVDQIKRSIKNLMVNQVEIPLSIQKLLEKTKNMKKTFDVLSIVSTIHQMFTLIKHHQIKQNYLQSLKLIDETLELITQDLLAINVIRHIEKQLRSKRRELTKAMKDDLLKMINFDEKSNLLPTLIKQVEESINEIDHNDSEYPYLLLNRFLSNSSMSFYQIVTCLSEIKALDEVLDDHKENIKNLIFFDVFDGILSQILNEHVYKEIKNATDNQSKVIGSMIRSLNKDEFNTVIIRMFDSFKKLIQHERELYRLIALFVVDAISKKKDPKVYLQLIEDQRISFLNMAQVCHSRCALIFSIHSSNLSKLSRQNIIQLMVAIKKFITKSERIINKPFESLPAEFNKDIDIKLNSLRQTLHQQGRLYLEKFHSTKTSSLTKKMGMEKWIANTDLKLKQETQKIIHSLTNETSENSDEPNTIMLSGSNYIVTNSILHFVSNLVKYFDIYSNTYSDFFQAIDIAENIKKYMGEYYANSKNLILMAHAKEIGTLETIKVSHLLMSSSCIAFISTLVPIVKSKAEAFLKKELEKMVLSGFDDLLDLLKSHRQVLLEKVAILMCDIVGDISEGKIAKWINNEWENFSGRTTPEINEIFAFLRRLYNQLSMFDKNHNHDDFKVLFSKVTMHYYGLLSAGLKIIHSNLNEEQFNSVSIRKSILVDIVAFQKQVAKMSPLLITDVDVKLLVNTFKELFPSQKKT